MRNQGIGSWTARRARKSPQHLALVHPERSLDYAELHRRCTRLAHALRGLGVRRGDRVGYLGPNHPAFLETLFAVGQLGAVLVPLNIRLAAPELLHQLTDSGTSVLVHAPECAAQVAALRADAPVRDWVSLRGADAEDAGYEELIARADETSLDEPVGLDELCMIMYTSGTTGRAKGAELTHGNLTWNSVNVLVDTDLAGDEVTLVSAPLFHTAALNMTCLPTLLKGGTVVLEQSFDPARTLEMIERQGVTVLFGVPAMYDAIAAHPRFAAADLSSVRSLLCGGAPVPTSTIRTYQARGLSFIQGYGMTEASPGVLLLDREHALAKTGSAGVPHFFTDARLAGLDGEQAAPGEPGEVAVQGPNVARGYWGLPDATAQSFRGGWFHTGDLAVADEDGYVTIVDRLKDMIISGGENIYPAEVENALYDHPAVAECAVVGVPDDKWGEVPRAYVVLAPGQAATEEQLLGSLLGRLAKYKIPKSVVFTGSLPRNAGGKVLKAQLRRAQ
jgi:fatty-acyl-CoA synthase